jgi:hypothetical protein
MAVPETVTGARAAGARAAGSGDPSRAVVALLGGWVGGSVAYALVVIWLARWPAAVRARGRGGAARPLELATVAAIAVVAVVVLLIAGRGRAWPAPRTGAALVLVASGAAWVAWGLLDQHVLRTFQLAPGSVWSGAWDGVFHGVGVTAAGVGVSMLGAGGPDGP